MLLHILSTLLFKQSFCLFICFHLESGEPRISRNNIITEVKWSESEVVYNVWCVHADVFCLNNLQILLNIFPFQQQSSNQNILSYWQCPTIHLPAKNSKLFWWLLYNCIWHSSSSMIPFLIFLEVKIFLVIGWLMISCGQSWTKFEQSL